jgi:uncharacterized protein (TIGR00159 family)
MIFNAQAAILSDTFLRFIQGPTFIWKDVLDVLIVAILIFLLLVLIKKTRALPMFIGILLLGGVYAASFFLQLRLTQTIFSGIISSLLIILAIIFQREFRRFFEFLGVMGIRRKSPSPAENSVNIIIQAIRQFCEKNIGALIVLPGKENIYRQMEGGVNLNGKLSSPLLLSIFDPSSPGHDGAVVIENDLIKRFACHLPMAENIEAVKKFGTRHRAALGLSEKTDAFIIVVSEEKGSASVAYNKKLIEMSSDGELELRLRKFVSETFPVKNFSSSLSWLKQNFFRLAASAAIAVGLWFVFTYQTSFIQKNIPVPLEFRNLDKQYIVDDYTPDQIIITFSGMDRDFNLLDPKNLKATIDLGGQTLGWHWIPIKKSSINTPSSLTFIKTDPTSIKVHITNLTTAQQQ